jgi:hypothetical protein
LARLGRPPEAIEILVGLVTADDADAGAWFDLGGVFLDAGRPVEAADALEAGLARDPDPPVDVLHQFVRLNLLTERYADAMHGYRQLLRRHGEDPLGHLVALGPMLAVPAWCAEHRAAIRPVTSRTPIDVQLPRYAGDDSPPERVPAWQPQRYVAEIPDATVIGGATVVVTSDADHLLDISGHPGAERFALTQGALRWLRNGVAMTDSNVRSDPIEAAISLVGTYSHNYYHWMLEILPRIANLEAAYRADELAGLPLLVDAAAARTPQLMETLRAVCPDRPIVVVDKDDAQRVRRLILPSQLMWLPPDLHDGLEMRAGDTIVAPEAIAFLRDRFLPLAERSPNPARRIVVTRPSSTRLANESDLLSVFAAFGLERVRPDRMSFAQQVGVFSETDLIVIEGGAAVTNIAFARPGTRVLVLVGDRLDHSFFAGIADHGGQHMAHLAGTRVGSHRKLYQCPYAIDPDALRRALDWMS